MKWRWQVNGVWYIFIFMELKREREKESQRIERREIERKGIKALPILERESRRDLYKYTCPLK